MYQVTSDQIKHYIKVSSTSKEIKLLMDMLGLKEEEDLYELAFEKYCWHTNVEEYEEKTKNQAYAVLSTAIFILLGIISM